MWVLQICCNGFVQSERGGEWGSANGLCLVMREGRVGFGRSSIDVLGSTLEEIRGYDIWSVGLFDERRGVFGR